MKSVTQLRFFLLSSLLFVLLSATLHAEKKVVKLDQLQVRSDLRYEAGQKQVFSGIAVSYFADGMKKLRVSFSKGLKHGKEVAWYDNGQLRYMVSYLNGVPQSMGSSWYTRTSEAKVAASALRFCSEEDIKIGFCNPKLEESSRIEFTP